MTEKTNEKNTVDIQMNLLPIVLILGLIFGAGYLMTKGEIEIPWLKTSNKVEVRRLMNFPTVAATNQIIDKQRIVISNEEELAEFLNTVDASGLLTLGEKIDFNREILIGVSTKTLSESDYTIKIKKVYVDKENNSLLVSSRQTKPGETCETENYTNVAVDIVAVSKTDKKIDFELIKETEECD